MNNTALAVVALVGLYLIVNRPQPVTYAPRPPPTQRTGEPTPQEVTQAVVDGLQQLYEAFKDT